METIKLPRKPRILKKEQAPDMRQFAVVPIRAITDRNLSEMQLRTLLMFCAYSNRAGLTWVGLQRIAEHFGLTMNTSAIHTRELIKKGYIKVLYHGYKGERAHTRQIVYKEDMKLEDIIAISGESAPYLQENQPVTSGAKGEDMNKRSKKVSIKSDSKLESVGNDYQLVKDDRKSQLETIRRAVGNELFSIAEQEAGENATLADIERILAKMLA
jgi:DNA-binding MarR family transcriptional regulator